MEQAFTLGFAVGVIFTIFVFTWSPVVFGWLQ